MKNLKLFFAGTAFFLFPATMFAQYEERVPKKLEVYNYTMGIRDLFPTQLIEIRETRIDVYNLNQGIQPLFPQKTMEINLERTEIQVFEVNNGIQNLFPTQVIKPIENVYQPTTPTNPQTFFK